MSGWVGVWVMGGCGCVSVGGYNGRMRSLRMKGSRNCSGRYCSIFSAPQPPLLSVWTGSQPPVDYPQSHTPPNNLLHQGTDAVAGSA